MARAFRPAALAAAIIALFLLAVSAQALSKGQPAPNFKLKGLDGKTYQLSDYKGKKPVLISFWAVWCPPCQRELPELQKLWTKAGKDVQFLGINVDGEGNVPANVKSNRLTFPIMIDKADVSRNYGIRYLPTVVLIDKKGIVRSINVGGLPEEMMSPAGLRNAVK